MKNRKAMALDKNLRCAAFLYKILWCSKKERSFNLTKVGSLF